MLRITLYRIKADEAWSEGVLHAYVNEYAIVENLNTGEIMRVPISPNHLKFQICTKDWVEMQVKARNEAIAAEAVKAGQAHGASIVTPAMTALRR